MQNPAADFASLLPGTVQLLVFLAREQPTAHLLLFSSAAVYGNPEAMPVCESFLPQPLSSYGWHKLAGETLCREYATLFDVQTIALRVFSAYGPGLRRQVLWDICNKLIHADKITLHGTGEETRDFLHVDDLARAVVIVSTAGVENTHVLNLASGASTGIHKLAALLRDKLAPGAQIEFSGHCLPGYPSQWSADIAKVCALGFTPSVPIEEGIADYVDWFRSLKP